MRDGRGRRNRRRLLRALPLLLAGAVLLGLSGCAWLQALFNEPPVAGFTVGPSTAGEAPFEATFSALASSDPDGDDDIESYTWDFGDGVTGTGLSVSHTYTSEGTYVVVLVVTDKGGETARASKTVYVTPAEPPGPTASFTASPTSGTSPLSVRFDASASSYRLSPLTYSWDFGDGATGSGTIVSHLYITGTAKTYTVTLTVYGPDGKSGTATRSITVSAAGGGGSPAGSPSARFDIEFPDDTVPTSTGDVAPLLVRFDPDNSEAEEGRTLASFTWTFGDDSSTHTVDSDPVTHVYETDSSSEVFSVTLVVIDDAGALDDITKTVRARNYQPKAGFEIYDTLVANALIGNEATALDDQDDFAGGSWVADDVSYNSVQSGTTTVFIRTEQVNDSWVGADVDDPETQGGSSAEATTVTDRDFDEDEFCFDPEGQGWDDTYDKTVKPGGWPNAGWGIEFIEISWGDGNNQTYDYYEWVMNGGDTFYHTYAFDNTTKSYTITVTARDFLGAEDSFSRDVTLKVGT